MPYGAGMATGRTVQVPVATPAPRTRTAQPPPTAADFPGCRPVRLPREELDDCEMRLEYWDAATETAWICDPVSSWHEGPARLLTESARLISQVRGAPVKCFGHTDLTERDAHGEPRLIMQADEMVYLHPAHARLPRPVLTVGEHDFPDVVLEVDHTTDVRRRKLPQYEAWGFPEVWVEVPEADAPSRPRSRRSGLTIHLLEDGAYRQAAASRAFPGWTAAEIHAALNEDTFSAQTGAVLERVGAVLGEREGTGPTTTRCWARSAAEAGRKGAPDWRGRCWRRAASRCRPDSPACRASPRCPTTSSRKPPPPASARPTFGSVCAAGSRPARYHELFADEVGKRGADGATTRGVNSPDWWLSWSATVLTAVW